MGQFDPPVAEKSCDRVPPDTEGVCRTFNPMSVAPRQTPILLCLLALQHRSQSRCAALGLNGWNGATPLKRCLFYTLVSKFRPERQCLSQIASRDPGRGHSLFIDPSGKVFAHSLFDLLVLLPAVVSRQVDVLPAQWRQVGQRAITGDTALRLGTSALVRNSGST